MGDDLPSLKIEDLVEQYLRPLYGLAYRLTGSHVDAEDLVQETFLLATEKLPQLKEPAAALAWLITIMRRSRGKLPRPIGSVVMPLGDIEAPEPASESGQIDVDLEQVRRVIDAMPDTFREPLLLYYYEELKYREIADILNCPVGTVMSRLARAKSYLRVQLDPQASGKKSDPA